MSVDSITDLDDNHSRLLEALQLSLPAETPSKKEKHRDKRLSLNPIYRQVPRVVDSCCQHIEKYGEHPMHVGPAHTGSSGFVAAVSDSLLFFFNRPPDCGDLQSGQL